jgi:hypothetical protein
MILAAPTVHLNGSSKERLLEALLGAHRAIDKAVDALKQAAQRFLSAGTSGLLCGPGRALCESCRSWSEKVDEQGKRS